MPVRIMPIASPPAAFATERNSTSTLGRCRETRGPSLTSASICAPRRLTDICRLPGAMIALPDAIRSPCSASLTSIRLILFSLAANAVLGVEHGRMAFGDAVPGPTHRVRRVHVDDLADDEPVEEHAYRSRALFYRGF